HDPCVPAMGSPYVAAAPVLDDITLMNHDGSTSTTKGVTVNTGTPVTLDVVLYSDEETTSDWKVVAVDAGELTGRTPKLSFAWDSDTGHNGEKRQLTITRIATGGRSGELVIEALDASGVVRSMSWAMVTGQ